MAAVSDVVVKISNVDGARTEEPVEMAVASDVMVRINPGVLRWVMDNEGWDADELAREAGLSASQIRRWASSESDISLGDLRRMSAMFKRSVSVFFMPEAPDVSVPPFYRRSGRAAPRMSREMLNVVRKARFVQENAAELMREMLRSTRPAVPASSVKQDAELAAALNADILGIGPPHRDGAGGGEDAKRYSEIREKIESRNVFVMQEAIPAGDGASGLALAHPEPSVVMVSSRDPARRRIFALLHEYAHVLLGADGVCSAGTAPVGDSDGLPRVEWWCDRFASAVLMPAARFRDAHDEVRREYGDDDPLRNASVLSDRFCVSRTAALTRAVDTLDNSELRSKHARCLAHAGRQDAMLAGESAEGASETGGPSQAAMCIALKGRKYARLVSDAGETGIITTSRMLEYLEIKLGFLDELRIRSGMG